ncbi:ribonuclease H2 subunit B-like [Penaeus monodon]|uniref:ribonuclease H2 subunit B-like n=1 Tax=Penaeus monodon TaxID=6687 RepID=UPI0018A75365|nr:ribonuclease H2 subunit B-like [Penaeus monodon]
MPRSPSKRIQSIKKDPDSPPEQTEPKCRQSVMFMEDTLFSSADIQVIKLKHPRTLNSAMFIYDKKGKQLFELVAFDEEYRSWLIGETVQSDGKLYITTPVDISYLILPYLMQATKNVPLDHLLEDDKYPAIVHVSSLAAGKDFSHIADRKGSPDLGVWKYSKESTLSWLEGRVRKLSTLLQEKKVPTSNAQSFTYVRAMNLEQTQVAYLALAHGILSDYIPEELSKDLSMQLQLPEPSNKQKALTGAENQPPTKKQKMEGPTEDYTKDDIKVEKNKTPQTAKAKALAKSASGSKSITSFFVKK